MRTAEELLIGRGPIVINGQVVGNFEKFQEQSTLDKRLYDIQDTLDVNIQLSSCKRYFKNPKSRGC